MSERLMPQSLPISAQSGVNASSLWPGRCPLNLVPIAAWPSDLAVRGGKATVYVEESIGATLTERQIGERLRHRKRPKWQIRCKEETEIWQGKNDKGAGGEKREKRGGRRLAVWKGGKARGRQCSGREWVKRKKDFRRGRVTVAGLEPKQRSCGKDTFRSRVLG